MARFIVIFLVCIAAAPLLPMVLEGRSASETNSQSLTTYEAEADDEIGGRVYKIERNRHGHYVADARLNGRSVDMLVDTGATVAALPESVAEDIGIFLNPSDYKVPVNTANGTVYGARATIDAFRIGDIRLRNIDALVLKDKSLGKPLLGMSVLGQLEKFDMSDGTLVLVQ